MDELVNWDDIPENNNNINYWKILDESDKEWVQNSLNIVISRDPSVKKIIEWTKENQKSLMRSYIKGLTDLKEDAFRMSMQDFGMYSYIAVNFDKDSLEFKPVVEPKPQSLQTQKELEELYTEENINKAIEEMGIFTNDDKGDT